MATESLKVVINGEDYTKSATDSAKRNLKGLSDETEKTKKSFLDMGNIASVAIGSMVADAFMTATNAAKDLAKASLGVAINYEKGLSEIKAITGATDKDIQKINKTILQLGKDTKYSAAEAEQGFISMNKAGRNVEQLLSGDLRAALDMATAGNISVEESATLLSDTLNVYKKDALSAKEATDILTGAANKSSTDLNQMKFAFAAVGPTADLMGLSLEETATAFAVFSNNGLKGSDAGTSFKTMLANLVPQTEKQAKMMNSLGVSFTNADGSFKNLATISTILKTKLKDLTPEQRQLAIETMFGSDAMRAASILYKEGAEGVVNMQKEIEKVDTKKLADEMQNNTAGAIERLKGSLETLAIMGIMPLLPHLQNLVSKFETFVNLHGEDAINSIYNAFETAKPTLITVFDVMGKGLGFLIDNKDIIISGLQGIGLALGVMGGYAVTMSILAGAIALLTNPITLVALGVAALKIAWDENFFGIQEKTQIFLDFMVNDVKPVVEEVFKWMQDKATETSDWFMTKIYPDLKTSFDNIKLILDDLKKKWDDNFLGIKTNVEFYLDAIKTTLTLELDGFKLLFQLTWDTITTHLSIVWETIKATIDLGTTTISGILNIALDLIKGDWKKAWDDTVQLFKDVWQIISDHLQTVGKEILQYIKDIFANIKEYLQTGAFNDIKEGATKAFSGIKDAAESAVNSAQNKINSLSMSNVAANLSGFNLAKAGIGKITGADSGGRVGNGFLQSYDQGLIPTGKKGRYGQNGYLAEIHEGEMILNPKIPKQMKMIRAALASFDSGGLVDYGNGRLFPKVEYGKNGESFGTYQGLSQSDRDFMSGQNTGELRNMTWLRDANQKMGGSANSDILQDSAKNLAKMLGYSDGSGLRKSTDKKSDPMSVSNASWSDQMTSFERVQRASGFLKESLQKSASNIRSFTANQGGSENAFGEGYVSQSTLDNLRNFTANQGGSANATGKKTKGSSSTTKSSKGISMNITINIDGGDSDPNQIANTVVEKLKDMQRNSFLGVV